MDLTEAIVPNSKQVNADDLITSPRTVTITKVEPGTEEQKVFIHLAEFPGRTYRPSKGMARVLMAAWGKESSTYTGRRLTIYRNPDIMFGPNKVGGIEISAMSDIDAPLTVLVTKSKTRRAPHTVTPLPAATPTRDWLAELKLAGDDIDAVKALGGAARAAGADEVTMAVITARYNELNKAGE